MEIRCPSCKKTNSDSSTCVRCGCELQTLQAILQAAESEISTGRNKLRMGNLQDALNHALRSWHLKNSHEAAKLAFLAHISEKRYEEALTWYSAMQTKKEDG
ncbi:MAG: hypothetical protein JETT_1018 [Candidatus Jettenia ecosi]|uniref:Uncharacterized protein n=1 Tax=Candidatus Jettenia ecosi TaxID=2494326 RepID=A0A533QD52_9BACT|nr:MAG: hypothetical protein JETT_1018 [Candidatus Jettenia ecosi]